MLRPHVRFGSCLVLCVALVVTACATEGDDDTAVFVEAALLVAAGSPSGTVNLGEAVAGGWTRLILACAYTDRDEVDKDLGFAWPEYTPTDQDGESTWVFATRTEVITWAVVRGHYGDPCYYRGKNPPSVVGRADAVFRVKDTGERVIDGRTPYRALRPAG